MFDGVHDPQEKGEILGNYPAKTCNCLLMTYQGQDLSAISRFTAELLRSLVYYTYRYVTGPARTVLEPEYERKPRV